MFLRLLGLPTVLLLILPSSAASQQPLAPVEQAVVRVEAISWEGSSANIGDEITIKATLQNPLKQTALVSVRLRESPVLAPLVPEAEQIVFIEGTSQRAVQWRAKVLAGGALVLAADAQVISQGWPLHAPLPPVAPKEKAALGASWSGTWKGGEGFEFVAVMRLNLDESGTVDGSIEWSLKEAPKERPEYIGKWKQTGVEYVWGFYDNESRKLSIDGYRRDDAHQILGLDKYRLILSDDRRHWRGTTWDHGTWQGTMVLERKE